MRTPTQAELDEWLDEVNDRKHRGHIMAARVMTLIGALREARATNTRLNQRLTKAEAAMTTTIEDCRRQGVSMGRGLANAGYALVEAADRDALAAMCADLQRRLDAVTALADDWRKYHDDSHPNAYWIIYGDAANLLRRALAGTDTDGGGE